LEDSTDHSITHKNFRAGILEGVYKAADVLQVDAFRLTQLLSQNMTFTLSDVLQLTIPPIKNVFFGVVVALAIYFLTPTLLRKWICDESGNPLPPGPPIRYAFLRRYPELAVDYWAKKYGPLFSIWMGTQLFVVISDPHIARDLLVTHGAIFSSRKRYFLKNQVILRGRAISSTEYGDKW